MSEWIEHDGNGMPIDGDKKVDVKFRDGRRNLCVWPAKHWERLFEWADHRVPKKDQIVAYRIISDPDQAAPPSA